VGAVLCIVAGIISLVMATGFFIEQHAVQAKVASEKKVVAASQKQLDLLKPVAAEVSGYASLAVTLHGLFDKQIPWQTVLTTIESRLYKHMLVTNIQASDTSGITLSGFTTSYDDYAKITASLTDLQAQKYFKSVHVVSVSKVEANALTNQAAGVNFTFLIIPLPQVLRPVPTPSS
jgi:Tfp pilus assembly protein PilN